MSEAPERIYLDGDVEAGDGMFPRCFENPKYASEPPVEYIRADHVIEPAPVSVREAARVLLGHTPKITAKPLAEMSEAMKIDAHPAILLRGFCAALRAIAEAED